MGKYGESCNKEKENLYDNIMWFLDDHPLFELFQIMEGIVEEYNYMKGNGDTKENEHEDHDNKVSASKMNKENLCVEIKWFLDRHPLHELLRIAADAVEEYDYVKGC